MAKQQYNVIVSYSEGEDLVKKAAGYKTVVQIAININKRKKDRAS
ncbi:MAG: hypothetical protein K0Q87_5553 [Neobacillus sp.]|nr:hypothetical protein [Neobacillus sp.]